MRAKCNAQRRLRRVANAVFRRIALDDLGDLRIVRVRHTREEMMLDLVVEPAEHPGEELVAGAEVDRRLDLVDGPDALVDPELLGGREPGLLDAMRELKRRRGDEARRHGEADVAACDDPPRVDEQRHDDRPADEDALARDDADEVPAAPQIHWPGTD